jgi:hypothetical protein
MVIKKYKKQKFSERSCYYDQCKAVFIPSRKWQKFCNGHCRFHAWKKNHIKNVKVSQ